MVMRQIMGSIVAPLGVVVSGERGKSYTKVLHVEGALLPGILGARLSVAAILSIHQRRRRRTNSARPR